MISLQIPGSQISKKKKGKRKSKNLLYILHSSQFISNNSFISDESAWFLQKQVWKKKNAIAEQWFA